MAQILVIEDDPSSLTLLFECLSGMGHVVHCATNRGPAEAFLSVAHYDLVISDLRLAGAGGNDGLEILAGVRAFSPATRLVLVSADLRPETERAAREIGIDGCFGKPLELRQLRQMVDGLVQEYRPAVC